MVVQIIFKRLEDCSKYHKKEIQIVFEANLKNFEISFKNFSKNAILFYVAINELRLCFNTVLNGKVQCMYFLI